MAKRENKPAVRYETEGRRILLKALEDMTESAIAKAVGVAQQQVSSWKHGKSRPKPEFRDALKRVIGAPPEAWYTRREASIAKGSSTPPPKRSAA